MPEAPFSLSPEQIAFYHREGYLALPAITTAADVERLQDIYDRLFATRAGREVGDHLDLTSVDDGTQPETLPQILNPSKYAPELADTAFRINAEAIAKQLLGPEAEFRSDHAIRKPPQTGVATPWHQDEAYWDPALEHHELSIWIPLQEATLHNGCMQFVPGTHQRGVLPHHPIGHDPRVIGLEVDDPEGVTAAAVACPIPAGGATIHHSCCLHYTGPNHSDQPRRAYILMFGVPPKPRPTPRDFYWLAQQQTAWQARQAAAQEVK
jgi:ectoine hydroxylase-related dioxygenase (phytanoyl-CoA dioxygenase family)